MGFKTMTSQSQCNALISIDDALISMNEFISIDDFSCDRIVSTHLNSQLNHLLLYSSVG